MRNRFSTDKVESIMESLGGMQRAAAPNFFYARLRAKMQPAADKKTFFILRPVFIMATLAVLLIVNVVSLFNIGGTPKQFPSVTDQATTTAATPATIESFAKAYDMNNGAVYE